MLAAEVKALLGELRLRQGRAAEARAIFDELPDHPRAMLGRGTLELEDGRPESALRIADRYLRQLAEPLRTDHVAGLWLLARAACAAGQIERAAAAAGKLETIAGALATDLMKGLAAASRGLLARARSDFESARADLEQAIVLFSSSPAPFEAAHARLDLASVLRALGEDDAADHEARAALSAFTRLGAARGIERARRESEPTGASPAAEETASLPLSDRELEVLRLLAQGLSNSEIAARLHLSSHTVKRHVANILGKLELPTRAAAAALAVRSGLS